MALNLRRQRARTLRRRADAITLGLAVLAVGGAGAVVAGEIGRLARRRRASKNAPTPESIGEAAGLATADAVAVARAGYDEAPHREVVLFNILSGFLGAFALIRLGTWGIRGGWWPTRDVRVGRRHVHHFVPGILIGFGCGAAGLVSQSRRAQETLALGFGIGAGLTFDEAALLLDFRDVYWSREGLVSVQISFAISGLLAASILALRMLRRGERRAEEEELIPIAP